MKGFGALIVILAVGWLAWSEGDDEMAGDEVVKSSRGERKGAGMRGPGPGSPLEQIKRFAAGLSDEELWGEMDDSIDDWLKVNRGRKWFSQPSVAILLSREIGKRGGESGMKEVATWVREQEEKLFDEGESVWLKRGIRFFEVRVRLAGFAGWVSDDPLVAISRLIESRKNREAGWPVVNEGMPLRLNMPYSDERLGMESVLRYGIREIVRKDSSKAYDLVAEGLEGWVFDASKVFEVLVENSPKDERKEFLVTLAGASSWSDLISREEERERVLNGGGAFEINGMKSLMEITQWMPGFPGELNRSQNRVRGQLDVYVRTWPQEARRVFENRVPNRRNRIDLLTWLSLEDRENYDLISQVNDQDKVAVVQSLISQSQEYQFGPLTGEDDPGALDLGHLREALVGISMGEEARSEIFRDLAEWNEGR